MAELHRCGGALTATPVSITVKKDYFAFLFNVPGWECAKCKEQLVDRAVAARVEREIPLQITDTATTYAPNIVYVGGAGPVVSSETALPRLVASSRIE